ncbi:MAG: integrase domain-containing protein [Magnetovibrio sp.]|nr:integrase domain-containing protein [Magnetovibrio sp.]
MPIDSLWIFEMERHKTDYQIKQILKYNRDGSPDKQSARHQNLMRMTKELQERGYSKRWDIHKLSKKEVHKLVRDWRDKGLNHKTIANRMADVRWLASKIGREAHIPSNRDVGIGLRKNAENHGLNKAQRLTKDHLSKMDERMQLVNQLKAEFGLRETEALKFQHSVATSHTEGFIYLKYSWCKGGRERLIQVNTEAQKAILSKVRDFQLKNNDKSMIPAGVKYKTYKNLVQAKSTEIGIKGHAFRHHWAQQRFEQVSNGLKAPIAGGTPYAELTDEAKQHWDNAAKIVNSELGHGQGREDITATYIGQK